MNRKIKTKFHGYEGRRAIKIIELEKLIAYLRKAIEADFENTDEKLYLLTGVHAVLFMLENTLSEEKTFSEEFEYEFSKENVLEIIGSAKHIAQKTMQRLKLAENEKR